LIQIIVLFLELVDFILFQFFVHFDLSFVSIEFFDFPVFHLNFAIQLIELLFVFGKLIRNLLVISVFQLGSLVEMVTLLPIKS
jgi:hypothetical protein